MCLEATVEAASLAEETFLTDESFYEEHGVSKDIFLFGVERNEFDYVCLCRGGPVDTLRQWRCAAAGPPRALFARAIRLARSKVVSTGTACFEVLAQGQEVHGRDGGWDDSAFWRNRL